MATPAVGVLLIDSNERILLVRHRGGSNQPENTYGFPAGHLGSDEPEKAGALRELMEETGLAAQAEDLVGLPELFFVGKIPMQDGSLKEFAYKVFLCRRYSGELTPSAETDPLWVPYSEIGSYQTLLNVKDAIGIAIKYIRAEPA